MKTMKQDLINFPEDFDRYRDTGEGGHFVMLFVPEPRDWSNDCQVDVSIRASRPDVLVHQTESAPIWGPWDSNRWDKVLTARKLLQEAGRQDLSRHVATSRSDDDFSVSMLAAVHLGSTGGSLWDEDQGTYWCAGYWDLTDAGKALYSGLRAAYGVKPVLATFLDT